MISAITNKIRVSVVTSYQQDYSYPQNQHFMFAYRISIENRSTDIVQLLRRHWYIVDAFGQEREVEGEGVIGEQPVIAPGECFEYVSGCDLKTEIGKMYGDYLMQNLTQEELFHVLIPEFVMLVPAKCN